MPAEFDDGDQYIVLITDSERAEMMILGGELDDGEGFGEVVKQVLGEDTFQTTEPHDDVGFVPITIPDAIGENGELICRMTM